jgi:hypothetical protein
MVDSELPVHPLFPPTDDEDPENFIPVDVQEIVVQRKEAGKYVTAPRTFLASELQDLNTIYVEYGGGEFQLIARDSKKIIRGRRLYILPGPSKPLFDEGPPVVPAKPTQTSSNPMMALMGGMAGQGEGGIMALVMMMMQQMMQANAAAQAQQTQMFIAMMQNSSSTTAADKAAQQEAYNRQREADRHHEAQMMTMMRELASAKTSSGGSEETFFKGVEFMRQFSKQEIENIKALSKGGETDLGGLLDTLGEAISGGLQLYQMAKGPEGAGLPTPEVPPIQ